MTRKKQSKKARLFIPSAALQAIEQRYGEAAATLARHLTVSDDRGGIESAVAVADQAARALDGVVHTTDTDCPYFPIVLFGANLLDDDQFFGACGIDPDDEVNVGGDDQPRLETFFGPQRKPVGEVYPTVQLLTKLFDDYEWEHRDEYILEEERPRYDEAAKVLEDNGSVVGGILCGDDYITRMVFVVSQCKKDVWAGVLTVLIET